MESTGEIIIRIIENLLFGEKVDTEKTFADIGYDSLDLANTIMEIEGALDIDIDETSVSLDMSINEFITIVERLESEFAEQWDAGKPTNESEAD